MEKEITRYFPEIDNGLNDEQLKERISSNLVNNNTSSPTKSVRQILYENIFTLFNFINLVLGVLVFVAGSYKNLLFLVIVICNTAISTIQALRSRSTVNKLSIVSQSKVSVIRNGKKHKINISEIVLDDIIESNAGDQIVTDCIIKKGTVFVNESFLTGESDAIEKHPGDTLLSGSFIISGRAISQVEHIGDDNYIAKLSSKAKYVKALNSEIMNSLNKIVKVLSIVIIPIGLLTFFNHSDLAFNENIVKTVGAIIGMIPEGLILLTSTVLAVSVVRLSKSNVLVQDIYCIETLARVDTLCLDKTGTLTEGKLEVKKLLTVNSSEKEIENIFANLSSVSTDINATMTAIRDKYQSISNKFELDEYIPFSSATKWSGASFKESGTYVMGAPEFVLGDKVKLYDDILLSYIEDYRIIVLAHSEHRFVDKHLPDDISVLGFVLIADKIRENANKTLSYFKKQGVDIKVISGDNPKTVSKIAKLSGVDHYEKYVDASTLKSDDDIRGALEEYTVFGRVTPEQKKSFVLALKEKGHTVAMTGDGVNDILALKESDCSIAMASGSDACRSVSMLVLLDSDFASMPKIVAEGRQTINNIQRSASLFLTKTIYSSLLAVLFILMQEQYPLMPIQLTLISTSTIGLPSFLLALEPNRERIKGKFLVNVLWKALPSAISAVLNIVLITIFKKIGILSADLFATACVIGLSFAGIVLLFNLAKKRKSERENSPVSLYRFAVAMLSLVIFSVAFILFKDLLNLYVGIETLYIALIILAVSIFNFTLFSFILKIVKKCLYK